MITPEKISPDDPRLTLYALGELEAAEVPAFEAALAADPAARATIDEIRRTAALLGEALEQEPAPVGDANNVVPFASLSDVRAAGILPAEKGPLSQLDGGPAWIDEYRRPKGSPWFRFPASYFTIAGLAAACFGVFFVLRESEEQARLAQFQRGEVAAMAPQITSVDAMAAPPPPMAAFAVATERAAAAEAADQAASERAVAKAVAPAAARAAAMRMAMVPLANLTDEFVATAERTTSTLPLRVGRESYAAVRDQLRQRKRPSRAQVQVAELVNAFAYTWPNAGIDETFTLLLEESAAPWSRETRLLRVGVRVDGERGVLRAREAQARVEFNPGLVRAWRLIGFERDEESVGIAGLTPGEALRGGDAVVAVYEWLPVESADNRPTLLAELAVDFRDAQTGEARRVVRTAETGRASFAQASPDQRFAAAVVAFGLALREPAAAVPHWGEIAGWAESGAGEDEARRELVQLIHAADALEN